MLDHGGSARAGQDGYRDVIDALNTLGLPTAFTQTGGSHAALEVRLDDGHTLLVTDEEESLSWDRDEHAGWGVGLYRPGSEYDDGPLAFHSTAGSSLQALLLVVEQLLRHRTGL
ncbi:hypothetical protein [Vallicoccus soli]|uniref:Uncharacterized protein n=1 Tax=Vallicoccus soli TaxID=2339232 RepID=A0A3A3ZBN2_9ACTN|nr:hypothetical protein [Vallicoccus soli]RJK92524.1 hypothetical protein D5H78_18780 [Vallicoccus soli]